jgi:hypothetical protein
LKNPSRSSSSSSFWMSLESTFITTTKTIKIESTTIFLGRRLMPKKMLSTIPEWWLWMKSTARWWCKMR